MKCLTKKRENAVVGLLTLVDAHAIGMAMSNKRLSLRLAFIVIDMLLEWEWTHKNNIYNNKHIRVGSDPSGHERWMVRVSVDWAYPIWNAMSKSSIRIVV